MKIDLLEFARTAGSASGDIAWRDLTRVDTPDRGGTLAWTATGSLEGRDNQPWLALSVQGKVVLVCQRCLQPFEYPIEIRARLRVASDEAAAEALDIDDDFDVIVDDPQFDLDALVEDEVILALPIVPRHAVCPEPIEAVARSDGRPSPFAVLAGLKREEH